MFFLEYITCMLNETGRCKIIRWFVPSRGLVRWFGGCLWLVGWGGSLVWRVRWIVRGGWVFGSS